VKEAIIYLLAVTAAEVITVAIKPMWGIVFHILILVALLLHAALVGKDTLQKFLLSLALVPLIRIISLSLPLANIPQVWWYPIVYAPLLVAALEVARLSGYRREQVGLTFKRVGIQLAIALTGLLFGMVEYFILREEAEASGRVLQETWLLTAFFLLVCTGFVEELMFRGVMQRSAEGMFGWWGIIYVSFLFGIFHLIHNSWMDVVLVFGIALFFGWVVKKTGSLLGVTLSHGIANIVLYLVIPLFF
jgi:membrane protease YdiL (CAAX protease family)